jgi:hypothetical protein
LLRITIVMGRAVSIGGGAALPGMGISVCIETRRYSAR